MQVLKREFLYIFFCYFIAMPPTSTAGDHGPLVSQHCDNRPQTNTSQATEQIQQQQNFSESHASPSPSTKKGSFFKKNVEDGMDRYAKLTVA